MWRNCADVANVKENVAWVEMEVGKIVVSRAVGNEDDHKKGTRWREDNTLSF